MNPENPAPFKEEASLVRQIISVDAKGARALRTKGTNQQHSGTIQQQLDHKPAATIPRRSSQITASMVGTSPRNVERVRSIFAHGTEDCITRLLEGKISIIKAYQESLKVKASTKRLQNPSKPDLASQLSAFLKEPIPMDGYARTWNEGELRLFHRLAEHLLAKELLNEGDSKGILAMIDRKITPFLGGSLIQTARETPHER